MTTPLLPLDLTLVGSLTERTRRIRKFYDEVLGESESIFSENEKTGWSINLPVGCTCSCSTPICAQTCYAALITKPARWKKCIKKQIRTFNYLELVPTQEAADRILRDFKRLPWGKRRPFLRVCGVGDLTNELVQATNTFVHLAPGVPIWVVTRNPGLAAQLDREARNLFVQYSIDASEESRRGLREVVALDHPRIYCSFLRTKADDEIPEVTSVVFNLQQAKGSLPAKDHPGVCPADAGEYKTPKGACNRCRQCFSPKVLR